MEIDAPNHNKKLITNEEIFDICSHRCLHFNDVNDFQNNEVQAPNTQDKTSRFAFYA